MGSACTHGVSLAPLTQQMEGKSVRSRAPPTTPALPVCWAPSGCSPGLTERSVAPKPSCTESLGSQVPVPGAQGAAASGAWAAQGTAAQPLAKLQASLPSGPAEQLRH